MDEQFATVAEAVGAASKGVLQRRCTMGEDSHGCKDRLFPVLCAVL
jgi:hypothetical protein